MKPVQNQSVGYLNVQKYCFITRLWPGPPITAVVETECQRGECSENMTFREGTPRPNPKVLAPLPPAPAPAPLAKAPGCLVSGNHGSGSKAPLTLPAAKSVLQAAPRNTGCLGQGLQLQARCPILLEMAVRTCVCCLQP